MRGTWQMPRSQLTRPPDPIPSRAADNTHPTKRTRPTISPAVRPGSSFGRPRSRRVGRIRGHRMGFFFVTTDTTQAVNGIEYVVHHAAWEALDQRRILVSE